MDINTSVTLNNGVEMPVFGLGVYQSRPGDEAKQAVLRALEAGYRMIDTAAYYRNERDVGEALRASGLPREHVFITTKLMNEDHGYEKTIAACERSLGILGLDHVDLYLIHWPVERLRTEAWRALETLLEEGKCRSIGVSNYTIRHLEELLEQSSTVPAVNQVEFHPFLYQKDLLEYCESKGIVLEAYSPLTRGERLNDPKLAIIASEYSKTPAQILIRWALQHGTVVIPKSVRRERIAENADVFDFEMSKLDMGSLDALDVALHTSWDPTNAP
jgi:diketogulonate reductase-like aldo/keto reductase